jgi:serine phosphatase RsbU (regulator of sigma subunit)
LLAFTDGVPEAKSPTDEQFSEERLEALSSTASVSAEQRLEDIKNAVHQHVGTAAQSDDITMLAIRRLPTA